jgi:ligand-binding sensor domain-containing protein
MLFGSASITGRAFCDLLARMPCEEGRGINFYKGFSISGFLEDSRGGLWVSTQEKGVFYCNNPDLLVYDTRFGFTDDFVSTVTFKNDSILFAGCENGDVFEFNISSDSIHWKKRNLHGYNNFFDLLYDTVSNRLWCHGNLFKGW